MLTLNRILYACDFSPCALRALPVAAELSRRSGATLHVVYVDVLYGDLGGEMPFPAAPLDALRRHLDAYVKTELGDTRLDTQVVVTRELAAAPALMRYADEHEIDLIVMGTHGRRGFRHLLLGSVAEELIRRAPCSVMTVREDSAASVLPSSILVPADFTDRSLESIRLAKKVAAAFGARVELMHVMKDAPRPAFYEQNDAVPVDKEAELRSLYAQANGPGNGFAVKIRQGRVGEEIVREAREEGIDLIVMTTHEPRGIEHLLSGSVAVQVSRNAPCPVLVYKERPHMHSVFSGMAESGQKDPV
jgi:nucleotide-binding universal stress UspA family protein